METVLPGPNVPTKAIAKMVRAMHGKVGDDAYFYPHRAYAVALRETATILDYDSRQQPIIATGAVNDSCVKTLEPAFNAAAAPPYKVARRPAKIAKIVE